MSSGKGRRDWKRGRGRATTGRPGLSAIPSANTPFPLGCLFKEKSHKDVQYPPQAALGSRERKGCPPISCGQRSHCAQCAVSGPPIPRAGGNEVGSVLVPDRCWELSSVQDHTQRDAPRGDGAREEAGVGLATWPTVGSVGRPLGCASPGGGGRAGQRAAGLEDARRPVCPHSPVFWLTRAQLTPVRVLPAGTALLKELTEAK